MSDTKPTEAPNKYGRLLNETFMVSYLVLFGYTVITLIEALRTTDTNVRHIMNIETAVSLVAGLVYGMFIERVKQPTFDLKEIMPLRYLDWSITTPLLLLAVVLFYNKHSPVSYKVFGGIVGLNWAMLYAGYLGETGATSRFTGLWLGFAFFAALLALLYTVIPKGSPIAVFAVFAVIWSMYGVAYMFEDEETKNITYNVLDVIAKALFGVVLWMYFGRVLSFKGGAQ